MKIIIKDIINESSEDKQEKLLRNYSKILNLPYFHDLKSMDVPEEYWEEILSYKLNQPVKIKGNTSYGVYNYVYNYVYDSNYNELYYEHSNGYWIKREYDSNGNVIYREDSNGQIMDIRNISINESEDKHYKLIRNYSRVLNLPYFYDLKSMDVPEEYWEDVLSYKFNQPVTIKGNGVYDQYGNRIYYENSNGYWGKKEYDSNGKEIYFENSEGYWGKKEYDSNGNLIYYEVSEGIIIDNRDKNINESENKQDKLIKKYSELINTPYFYDLKSMDVPEEYWENIFSNKFNQPVTVKSNYGYDDDGNTIYSEDSNNSVYDSNGEELYYENSDGYWSKSERDSNGNELYNEDSNGFWYKKEYDSNNNIIYYENSNGYIDDRRNLYINESEDKQYKLIRNYSKILNLPYFYDLKSMDVPEEYWEDIFSNKFNQPVKIKGDYVYNQNGNELYYENSEGYWIKIEYDGYGNELYNEDSNGYWSKYEYDENGNRIYSENSNGYIIDNRDNFINESKKDKYNKLLRKYSELINLPYFYDLKSMDVPKEYWKKILSIKFNQPVKIKGDYLYNSNGKQIYYEDSEGFWGKKEYDSNDNVIDYEDSDGEWYKKKYNQNGNQIYYENNEGYWSKKEYDENGNVIYREDSDGYWHKYEYDSNGKEIYFENSKGEWIKIEYDANGNKIYYEDSDGKIVDKRNNSINESSENKQEKLIRNYSRVLNIPYYQDLKSMDVPKEYWEEILSYKFNQNVKIKGNYVYDINGNRIYYEDSEGFWLKREYDENGSLIYYENSNGHWSKYEYDENGNEIYSENSDGYWYKYEYDQYGNRIYSENSDGFWSKREYDQNENRIYYENSEGYWSKKEYDENGNVIYREDSDGKIIDKRNNN